MLFWSAVIGVVTVTLFFAWRADRRRKVTIDRHHPGLEHDITQASIYHRSRGRRI